MPTPLPDHDVEQALSALAKWKRNGNAIERDLEFPDFRQAMAFVNRIADAAETVNHHPDITINYNKVKLALTSHDSGGITNRDLNLAARINDLVNG